MKLINAILPAAALGLGAFLLLPTEQVGAWTTIGGNLSQSQRDVRVYNNFLDSYANNNTTVDDQFPGFQGAYMAIWKGCVEWGSIAHGDGSGDPSQSVLGSGGANFDISWQGVATEVGGTNANIHSAYNISSGGVLAWCETPISDGWRIRYLDASWTWDDGPGTAIGGRIDIQSICCHEYGHALGLGHSSYSAATMYAGYSGGTAFRSIHSDDIAGVQYIYGAMSGSKPTITSVNVAGGVITITGNNFSPAGNEVWFTHDGTVTSGIPVKVTGLTSNGTTIAASIPSNAGPGDVLVRNYGSGHSNLSNAYPTDLQGGSGCPDPSTYCVTSPNSVGSGALMGWLGTTSLQADDFHLVANLLPPNQFLMFYYGGDPTQIVFGNGYRCVAAGGVGIYRFAPFKADFSGFAAMKVDYTQYPAGSGSGEWLPGDEWYAQAWYRDPDGGGALFNLSDAIHLTICP